jgi:aspartyl/asparaginyl-tRNA synthetase
VIKVLSDDQIIKISLVFSFAGIIALFILVLTTEPGFVEINSIDSSMLGENVKTVGYVKGAFESNGHVFLTLEDGGPASKSIKVVMFKRDAEKQPNIYSVRKGDNITVLGKISIYKGELEIIARKVI